jgi:hypothetical protein
MFLRPRTGALREVQGRAGVRTDQTFSLTSYHDQKMRPEQRRRTHLKNRGRVRGQRFGMAARREEREYPWWIFDRRATPPPGQRSATLWAVVRRAADCVAPQSQNPDGYAPSSRLVTGPPEHSAPMPYL